MTSPDKVLDYHKLQTKFFDNHVQHTAFRSDASRGKRRVKVVKTWYRGRELGRGGFGTVFLETSEIGEQRAVKEIARDKSRIDIKRELMAMAILAKVREHGGFFVQFFGWYESSDYVHIAMEYISHGNLRGYLMVERSEHEAKVTTRQLLEGLVIIHQEGFAHRDLKPENIFVVSTSPMWVKIGDFGLAKLAADGTAFRTEGGTRNYVAPEIGIDTNRDTSEYTNAVDIWALGCITHEILTQALPFRGFGELMSYCKRPEPPRGTMLSKNISKNGIEFVGRTLAYPPECRMTAKEALDSEWLRLEGEVAAGQETKHLVGLVLREEPAPSGPELVDEDSPSGSSRVHVGPHNSVNREQKLSRRQPPPRRTVTPGVMRVLEQVLLKIKTSNRSQRLVLNKDNVVQMLLDGVISMDIRDSAGNAPLHILASRGSQAKFVDSDAHSAIRTLVASGAPIDAKNSQGQTALLIAVQAGRVKVANILLKLRANIEEPDLNGNRPLITAVGRRDLPLVNLLLEHGAYTGTVQVEKKSVTPLHLAAEMGWNIILKDTLQKGADVNARDSSGQTPLHKAVIRKHFWMANELLLAGADVGARDAIRRTPLHHAVIGNSVALVDLLLDYGANPDVQDQGLDSPRREAARANFTKIVEMFG